MKVSAPKWLRDLGFGSWLLVGFVLIIVGTIWLLGQTSTIVMPVILAAVLGAVAGPAVGWLEHHRVPRIGGAIMVLLGLVAIGVIVFLLIFGGISAQSGEISAKLNQALDRIRGWLDDLGMGNAQDAADDVAKDLSEIRATLLSGISTGVSALSSLVFFLAFATLSTLFVLKDGPVMHRFINRHLGVPQPVANVVTTNVAKSLRSYFLGVTIIAAFNAVLVGGAALILGVPLAGTIAVVTFVGAYVPVRRRVGGRRLRRPDRPRDGGHRRGAHHGRRRAVGERRAPADHPTARDGRDARTQPARGARRHDRSRRAVRNGRADARGAMDLRGHA
jgi:predicted PurR-regulated permease PerM